MLVQLPDGADATGVPVRFVAEGVPVWSGDVPVPPGGSVHVELDPEEVAPAAGPNAVAPSEDGCFLLTGQVEDATPDGVVVLRVGPTLVLVDADGTVLPPPGAATTYLVRRATLHDIRL